MPQVFQALRCYKCLAFQVHQTKKSNKFECKLCGEKQSIKRHYGVGTAKECRLQVQKLNGIRGERDEAKNDQSYGSSDEEITIKQPDSKNVRPKESKWSDYIDKVEDLETNTEDAMYLDDNEVVLEVPKKRLKKLGKSSYKRPPHVAETTGIYDCEENNLRGNVEEKCGRTITPSIKQSIPIDVSVRYISDMISVSNNIDKVLVNSEKESSLKILASPTKTKIQSTPVVDSSHVNNRKRVASNENDVVKSKPTIQSDSKWAQFVDADDVNESFEEDLNNSENSSQDNPPTKQLFALCDDSDIDDILNF